MPQEPTWILIVCSLPYCYLKIYRMVSHSILPLTFIEKKLWQWAYNSGFHWTGLLLLEWSARDLINAPSWNHLVELGTVFQSVFYVFYESKIYIEFSVPNRVHWYSNQEVEVGSPSHTIILIYPLEYFALPISKLWHLSGNCSCLLGMRTVLLPENTVWYPLNCNLELPHYYSELLIGKSASQVTIKKKVTIIIIHWDFLKGDDGTIFTPGDPVGFLLVLQCPTFYENDKFHQPYQQEQRTKQLSVWATMDSTRTIPPIKQPTSAKTMAQGEENL